MRFYRALLRLFPRPFRERFGDDMNDVFTDRWRAARRRGLVATAALAAQTLGDITTHAAAERRRGHPSGDSHMRRLMQDIRFAGRSFRRQPLFTGVALATIALGIGANVAIFSVVRPLLLAPLPYPNADRIVAIYEHPKSRPDSPSVANPMNFDAWERRTDVFAALAGYSGKMATLTGAGDPVRLKLRMTTASLFRVFDTPPMRGRVFTDEETATDAPVIVLSEALWRSRFGADASVLTRTISLDGEPWQVVGVMPAAFRAPGNADAWIPLTLTPELRANQNTRFLGVAGLLAPGVSMDVANAALNASMAQLNAQYPRFNRNHGAHAVDWKQNSIGRVEQGLWMLQAVAVGVLLIACANLANLLLAHGAGRAREFAVRMAIGAGRAQVFRQIVTESTVLSVAGGVIGLGLAAWAVPAIASIAPNWLPYADELTIRTPDIAAALALSVLAGLLFGALPALFIASGRAVSMNLSTRGATTNARQRRTRSLLVAAQVAIALVFISGAGLLIRSFMQLTAQPIGFTTSHVLTAELALPPLTYDNDEKRRQFFTTLIDDVSAQPGVVSASGSTALPFTWWEWMDGFRVLGQSSPTTISAGYRLVTPTYFDTLSVPLIRGRGLGRDDVAAAPRVAVVNEAFAREYAALGDPIGLVVQRDGTAEPITIVGIAGDTRHRSFERPAQAEMYLPVAQWGPATMTLAVKTVGDPMGFAPTLRRVLAELDPNLPISEVRPLEAWVGDAVAERRFYMVLLGLFAGVAGVLAAGGIYGVMAYLVNFRMREVGIRVALGASSRSVQGLVVRQGMTPVALGLAIGLGVTLLATKVLRDQLFQLEPRDPVTIGLALVLFVAIGLAACWLPSRRTAKADPAMVLRNE